MGLLRFIFRVLLGAARRLFLPALLLAAGWYGGATFGAPDPVLRAADSVIAGAKTMLAPLLGRGAEVAGDIASQGGEYVVGTVEQMIRDLGEPTDTDDPDGDDAPEREPAADEPASSTAGARDIVLCPRMAVSNAPRADRDRIVAGAGASVSYRGVDLLLMPATGSCLSSGYGSRNGRLHKGVDYYPRGGEGDVLAAGDGVVIQAVSRRDYGNMLVIDHGNGVYTLYAHLSRFNGGVRRGVSVSRGQRLGPIGASGASSVKHLHWEVLSGEWNDGAGPFGLDPINPFAL